MDYQGNRAEQPTPKRMIAILGSTGSIGTQTLNVVRRHPERFGVEVLCAGSNAPLLAEQAREFSPNAVVIADESKYVELCDELSDTDIKVYAGVEAMSDVMTMESIDLVVAAIVGFAGLQPTLRAIESGKAIALANKETLVVAGERITQAAMQHHVPLLPVDSEHSAIFQCLIGEDGVDKLLLTASGGPFRGMSRAQLASVSVEQALQHPNWSMGAKVTIDSATLMNKGLEMIEAKWLFGFSPKDIQVLVHPQSIVHSMVQFRDGCIKAQLGVPTMETPIQYALAFPERIESHLPRLDFEQYATLTFEYPDRDTFRCLDLAYSAIDRGGNMPCIMNAANEVAVERFLRGEIAFLDIASYVEHVMATASFIAQPTLDDLIQTHNSIRRK